MGKPVFYLFFSDLSFAADFEGLYSLAEYFKPLSSFDSWGKIAVFPREEGDKAEYRLLENGFLPFDDTRGFIKSILDSKKKNWRLKKIVQHSDDLVFICQVNTRRYRLSQGDIEEYNVQQGIHLMNSNGHAWLNGKQKSYKCSYWLDLDSALSTDLNTKVLHDELLSLISCCDSILGWGSSGQLVYFYKRDNISCEFSDTDVANKQWWNRAHFLNERNLGEGVELINLQNGLLIYDKDLLNGSIEP